MPNKSSSLHFSAAANQTIFPQPTSITDSGENKGFSTFNTSSAERNAPSA